MFDPVKLHSLAPTRYPHFIESSAGGSQGRYDVVFACPQQTLVLDRLDSLSGPGSESSDSFLSALDQWWTEDRLVEGPSELPFRGGWFLYLGYELVGQIEPSLDLATGNELPIAFATRMPAACIADHRKQCGYIVLEATHKHLLGQIRSDVEASLEQVAVNVSGHLITELDEDHPSAYLEAVTQAKHYIQQGDVYQANLSRAWEGQLRSDVTALSLYRRLRRANPAPFSGFVSVGSNTLVSSSPERLLRIKGDFVDTRPIAGTRPRGGGAEEDKALSEELIAHPKERAEHIMLIDLERNDLGRICEAGSVTVNEMMVVESYARVHHIVSNVRGRIRKDVTPGQAIAAVFPGGTITGCPKVRCMEIISELEGVAREAYTGSFGYLNHNGDMDLNILIRTFVVSGQRIRLRAGAGIVADSDPDAELNETRAKARGLIDAISANPVTHVS